MPRWNGCPYVVPNPDTLKPFVQIHKAWDNARIAAGLGDFRLHDARHTFASQLAINGKSLYLIGKILGHSRQETTERYSHLSESSLLEAVNGIATATGTDWGQTPTT